MSASLSADIFSSMCFCTNASQNSCNCCAMRTCLIVRNWRRSVPHIDNVCHTVRACSYHCDREANEAFVMAASSGLGGDASGAAAPADRDPGAGSPSRMRCFCEDLARPIQSNTFSRNCRALSAYKLVGRETCKPNCTSSLKALGMTKIDSLSKNTRSCNLKDCGFSFCCNSCTDSSRDFLTVATHSYCCCWFTMLKHWSTKPIAGDIRASFKWYNANKQT
mmetsp:Transcript_7661/g.22635  ORF Transcript_7661/g.22635 Transcript_7661/m.22635 type:complete len:221 (-) Transcript_7661:2128-2790(-)